MARLIESVWLQTARKYTGLREVDGPQSNPVILTMAREIGAPAWYHDDSQPWCAVFLNAVLLESGKPMAIGTRGDPFDRLRALTFLSYGQSLAGPALGAIAVFSRPEGAHVGFYVGEHVEVNRDGKTARRLIRVFGGNQSNQVCETWIDCTPTPASPTGRLRGFRWPPGEPLPPIGPILLAATGEPISRNEA